MARKPQRSAQAAAPSTQLDQTTIEKRHRGVVIRAGIPPFATQDPVRGSSQRSRHGRSQPYAVVHGSRWPDHLGLFQHARWTGDRRDHVLYRSDPSREARSSATRSVRRCNEGPRHAELRFSERCTSRWSSHRPKWRRSPRKSDPASCNSRNCRCSERSRRKSCSSGTARSSG